MTFLSGISREKAQKDAKSKIVIEPFCVFRAFLRLS